MPSCLMRVCEAFLHEIMHDIHARKRDDVVVDPTFFDDMAAAEVEFHRMLVFNGLIEPEIL